MAESSTQTRIIDEKKKNFDEYLNRTESDIGQVIHELWVAKDDSLWSKEPYFYEKLGTMADRLGQSMFAHDILREGLRYFPGALRMTQLFALSQIKCGYLLNARRLLTQLLKKGHDDEETLGMLGRVFKEMWQTTGGDSLKDPNLRKSRYLYLKAFIKNRGYYSGINAASLSLMMGERETAEKLAARVLKICRKASEAQETSDYWLLATLGEAHINLGEMREAARYFRLAKRKAGKNFSYLASTRRQLKLLGRFAPLDEDILDLLKIPQVVAFTGHMIDSADRPSRRFPARAETEIRRKIDAVLDELEAGIGYSSAACGSDILFLESLQSRNGESIVVLPFDQEDFLATSVSYAGEAWINRAKNAVSRSSEVIQATRGRYMGDNGLFTYANRIIMGKAILRSRLLETDPIVVSVWDGKTNSNEGGTSEFMKIWQSTGLPLKIIDISPLGKEAALQHGRSTDSQGDSPKSDPAPKSRLKKRQPASPLKRKTMVLLFADLVGYSRLVEEQVPWFVSGFLGTLAERMKRLPCQPIITNIWGDALFFVFEDMVHAAEYALDLRDVVRQTEWERFNLPKDLNIRIGLHAGPVYYGTEPVLKRLNCFGSHVNHAARIEPITSPGNVYASEQFAALLNLERNEQLDCRYIGIIVLPKEFGEYPIYHIKRKNEID